MARSSQNADFLTFAQRHRRTLAGAAYLIFGDVAVARRRVDFALAQLYRDWPRISDPLATGFSLLLSPAAVRPQPWQRGHRFELVDANPSRGGKWTVGSVERRLEQVDGTQRRQLVLRRYAELAATEVARLTGTDASEPAASDDSAISRAEMVAAVEGALGPEPPVEEDLRHGRLLLRRRRLRGSVAAAAAVLVGVVGVTQLRAESADTAASDPVLRPTAATSPTPSLFVPRCSRDDARCRLLRARAWREGVFTVTRSYLDPEGRYFTAYSYGYDGTYDSDSFWAGQGGALGVDLFRSDSGGTEVTVQIATDRSRAIRCGAATRQRCVRMRFLNGNWFTLTETTHVFEGIEVQYRPTATEVITVVARNVSNGSRIDLTRGDLISLVQDPRLRLPPV